MIPTIPPVRTPTLLLTALALGAAGCSGPDVADPPKLLDTGWFETSTTTIDPEACEDAFVTVSPEDGTAGWYWRDAPELTADSDDLAAYSARLVKADGTEVPVELTQNPSSNLRYNVVPSSHLEPNTDYELHYADCFGENVSRFRTSSFGQPLADGPTTVSNKTYLLDLVGATWTEPAVLAGIISIYFNTPILLGVRYADDELIDLLGAPGLADDLGNVIQDRLAPSWSFPLTDFTESPYVEIATPEITLQFRDGGTTYDIPVEDFLLQATFSEDGNQLGGAVLSGFADSRYISGLIDPSDPGALCDLALSAGVSCQACTDGQPYCLRLVGKDISGEAIPGLILVESGG